MKKNVLLILIFTLANHIFFSAEIDNIIDNYIRYNNWNDAKINLEIYLKKNRTDSYAYSLYSLVLKELKMYDESIVALRNAINNEKSNEKKGELYFNLGNLFFEKGQKDISIEMYQKSLEFNDMLSQSYYMMGLVNFEKDSLNDTLVNWKKYLLYSIDIEKKRVIEQIVAKIEDDIKTKKYLEEKRAEEEKIKKERLLNSLKDMLENDKKTSTSFEEYKIDKKKKEIELEEIE